MENEADRHQGSYDKGIEQGKVLERLEGHDQHFRRINGSIDKTGERLSSLEKTVDRMVGLLTVSSAEISMGEGRRTEKESVQQHGDQRWSRAIVMVLAGIAALLVTLIILQMS